MKTQTASTTRRNPVEPMTSTDDALDNLPLNHVLHGDCRELLAKLPANSVDLVFADPPYNLQLKGELWRPDLSHVDAVTDDWDKFASFAEYDKFTRQWLYNCRRVLKDNGTLWVIGSYHNIYRVGAILQDLDYWILNDVVWCKCLAATVKVYAKTQKGEKPTTIKDLVRLDPKTVKLWNGEKWTQVLGWNEARSSNGFTLELRSGERLACTAEHRWATQRGLLAASELCVGDVLDTCRLPEPEHTVRPEALDDEIVGWFIGLYLAEGSRYQGTIDIAGHTKEVERYARLCKLAEMYHGQCTLHVFGENRCSIHLHGPVINALLDMYLQGNTARGKHLNPRCWERSNCFLKSILDGYLSGDGHYDKENDRWRLGLTTNYLWRDDLRTICARLGVSLRIRDGRIPYKGNPDHAILKGEIRFQRRTDTRSSADTEIMSIKPASGEQFWDIAVEDEPHLFALASGVLTHNSNPMPNFKGTRFCNAHETLLWAAKSEKQTKYTFNYKGMKAGNDDLQVRSDWHLPICTGDERLKENGEKAHATQKPEALIHRVLRACSNPGDVVLDPFFGTGTTGAVAKKMRRNFIGMEKEAKYVDLARARINAVTAPLVPDELMPPPLDAPKAKIPFVMLLEYGLLQAGDTLQLGRKGVLAYVLEDGTIVCNQHRGSIHKVGALCQNKPSCNGWEHWYYVDKKTKKLYPIDNLREQLRKMTAK